MSASFIRGLGRILVAATLVCVASGSQAHHSFSAQYDSKKPVTKTGVMTKLEWTNTHVYICIDVRDPATKKVSNWAFEMGPPHMLQRAGWKKNELKIGEELTIDGWLARDGSNGGNARRVMRKTTGQVLGAASSSAQTLGSNQGTKSAN